MEEKQAEVSLKAQLEEAERKGREEGREEGHKKGMADMFSLLSAADAGESQGYLLRTNCHSDVIYFQARVSIAMIEAAKENNTELLHFFLEAGADINFCDENDCTALQLAVFSGQIELVKTLLKAGADPNLAFDMMEAPLRSAVGQGDKALVNILLKAGANLNTDKEGYWLINYSAAGDHVEMTQLLLDAGAYIGPYEQYDILWTPLMLAAAHGKGKAAALLIKAGCDVNAQDGDGETVLMRAGSSEAVRLLLSAGADVFSRAKAREARMFSDARKAGNAFDLADDAAVKDIIKREMHRRVAAALSVLPELPIDVRQKIVQLYIEE